MRRVAVKSGPQRKTNMRVTTDNKDNKYSKVLVIVQRAKQLHNGARPRIATLETRHTCIAIEEVERRLIGFHHLTEPAK